MRKDAYFAFVYSLCFLLTGSVIPVVAQDVHGTVRASGPGGAEALGGAHVYWLGTTQGTTTDQDGHFHLRGEGVSLRRLVISHVAFVPDTVDAGTGTSVDVLLHEPRMTDEVAVTAQAPETYIASTVQKTEVITSEELEKAACCDLSGCFGTTSSVQPEAVDIISDTKQLSMLGLEGVYTQVLVDNVPGLTSGLNTHLGMSFIPGPLIDRIGVSKGATSILQGPEAFSGQINVLLLDSDAQQPLLFNAFGNSHLERQYNAYAMHGVGNWSGMLAVQLVQHGSRVDRNDDAFLDMPLTDRASVFAKWKFDDAESVISNSGVKYTQEDRLGGQTTFDPAQNAGGTELYGQRLKNERIAVYNTTDLAVGEESAVKLHAAASLHAQDAYYGTTTYDARENAGYVDASLVTPYEEEHSITMGASFRYTDLREDIGLGSNPHAKTYAGSYVTREVVPGIFAENKSAFFDDALTVIAGARLDVRNDFGPVFTPRLFFRYGIDERTTVRGSAGTAYRVARVFAENPAYFASWRDIAIIGDLQPERAVNYGVNLTRLYDIGPVSGTLTFDLYRTQFSQQVVAEFDADPDRVLFMNLEHGSASDNLMAEATATLQPFTLRLSYTYSDVYEYADAGIRRLPFTIRHRVLSVLSMQTADEAWLGSVTAEWRGAQALPNTAGYPAEFQLPDRGDAYMLVNLHGQYRWEWLDIYAGVENILDFRQMDPIVNAANPFQPYFEPTMAWGPVKGREAYAGFRVRIDAFGTAR